MIIQPFGFLGISGELPGTQIPYKNIMRALGPQEYWGAEAASSIYRDEFWQWSATGGAITHNTSGSPILSSPGYLFRPSAAGTQFHRYNAVGVMGPAFVHSLWTRFPDPNDSSGKSQMFFQQGGSDLTELIYHSASNFASWRALRGGVNKYLSYASYITTNTWHYICYQWKNDGTLWLTVDGILRATDAHAGGASTTTTLLWVQNTPDWNVDYDAVAVWKGPSLTGETTLINMNRPYWIVQNEVGYPLDTVSSNPIVYYRLGEPSGLPVNKITPGTYDVSSVTGTITQGVTPGLINSEDDDGCISAVNGDNHYYVVPTLPDAADTEDVAMSAFCEFSSANAFKVIGSFDGQEPQWELFQDGTAVTMRGGIRTDTGYNGTFTSPASFDETLRQQFGFFCAGPGSDQEIVINGVIIYSNTTAGTQWAKDASSNVNHIGNSDVPSGGISFGGKMDEFKYWVGKGITLLDLALENARARNFDSYEFEIAKRTPAMHMRCVDVDVYQTNKFEPVIGPNYGTRSGNVLVNRTGPQFVQDAGHLAADFDGTNDHIALTDPDLDTKVNGTGNFTISAWAYFDSFGVTSNSGRVIIRNDNSYMLYQFNDLATLTGVQFFLTGITLLNSDRPQYPLSSMSTGQWYHFVATYDSTAGEAKLYVDGVLQSTKTGLSGTLANPSGAQTRIGESGGGFYDMDGAICHVTVDPAATWTLQQVRYSYYLGLARSKYDAYALSLSPDGYWPLNETAGTTATDEVNAYNGTYTSTYTLNSATPFVNSNDPSVNFGNPGYVVGTANFGNNGGTQFTIAGWVRPDNNGSNQYFASKYSGISGWAAFRVYRSSTNQLRFYIEDGTRNPFWQIDNPGVFGGLASGHSTWYHFCFVWDRVGATGASTDVTGYINGYKFPSLTYTSNGYTGAAFTFTEGNTEFRFMSLSANSGTQAEGTGDLAKVFIKNGTLTDAQVRGLYLAGLELDLIR